MSAINLHVLSSPSQTFLAELSKYWCCAWCNPISDSLVVKSSAPLWISFAQDDHTCITPFIRTLFHLGPLHLQLSLSSKEAGSRKYFILIQYMYKGHSRSPEESSVFTLHTVCKHTAKKMHCLAHQTPASERFWVQHASKNVHNIKKPSRSNQRWVVSKRVG